MTLLRRLTRRTGASLTGTGLAAVALAATGFAGTAAAHSGTTHAGTPHWLLFVLVLVGAGLAAGTVAAYRREMVGGTAAALVALAAGLVGAFGLMGLVELQVVSESPPELTDVYPTLSFVVAAAMAVASLVLGRSRWPERPRYAGLGILLAAWVVYPVAMPNGGTYHPLGHAVVLSVVGAVGYVVRRDAWAVVQSIRRDRPAKLGGLAAALVFVAFFAVSAGTITFNPDSGVGAPTETLVVFLQVSDPLVAWPAVEFVFPSVPMGGFVSVGTVLLFSLLGSLVALNVGVLVQQYRAETTADSSTSMLGMTATTGATACCCCAPAFYGVLSVLFGASATPAYWAFLDPSSPLGGVFFAASVVFMLGGVLRATGGSAAVE